MALAAAVLAQLGAGERGTQVALQATARLSFVLFFVLFWPAYSAAALAALFGPSFQPLQRRAGEFGRAFAAAHVVHLGVGRLAQAHRCAAARHIHFFGIATLRTYFACAVLVPRLQQALGASGWWLLRIVGLNYIAFASAVDFV